MNYVSKSMADSVSQAPTQPRSVWPVPYLGRIQRSQEEFRQRNVSLFWLLRHTEFEMKQLLLQFLALTSKGVRMLQRNSCLELSNSICHVWLCRGIALNFGTLQFTQSPHRFLACTTMNASRDRLSESEHRNTHLGNYHFTNQGLLVFKSVLIHIGRTVWNL